MKIVRFIALLACLLAWIPVFFNIGDTDIVIYKVMGIIFLVVTIAAFFIGGGSEHKDV